MKLAAFSSTVRFATRLALALALVSLGAVGCGSGKSGAQEAVKPVYDINTGKLTQLTADRDHDGKIDTRAFMDGVHLDHIELDRNNDGTTDRWEYYTAGTASGAAAANAAASFDKNATLDRAEEANGPDPKMITRREFYEKGVIARVEEDTDFDGKVDKWEFYVDGALQHMDLDLKGRGTPDRRLVYRKDGQLDHMESDEKGDGKFVVMRGGGL